MTFHVIYVRDAQLYTRNRIKYTLQIWKRCFKCFYHNIIASQPICVFMHRYVQVFASIVLMIYWNSIALNFRTSICWKPWLIKLWKKWCAQIYIGLAYFSRRINFSCTTRTTKYKTFKFSIKSLKYKNFTFQFSYIILLSNHLFYLLRQFFDFI